MQSTAQVTDTRMPEVSAQGTHLDWTSILGGAVVAVATGSVFAAFGAALGLSTISAGSGGGGFNKMVIVTGLWIVLSLTASYMAGGYIAGRMRRRSDATSVDEVIARDGMNGLVVWGLGVIVTLFLAHVAISTSVSAAGTAAKAAGSVLGIAALGAGEATSAVADSAEGEASADNVMANPLDYIASTLLRPTQISNAAADTAGVSKVATTVLVNIAATGEVSEGDHTYLAGAAAAQPGVAPDVASARADAAIAAAQALRSKAVQFAATAKSEALKAADQARAAAVVTAFVWAAASLVAAVAAHGAAVIGGRHRDEGRLFGGFAQHQRRHG